MGEVKQVSIVGITLLGPGIAAVVITAHLPIARRIFGKEFDRLYPLRTLPEIEMWHHEAHRPAMLDRQRLASPTMGEQGVVSSEILQAEVGGVAVVGMQHHEA